MSRCKDDINFSGMLSAAASLGMILLWDVDGGLTQIDKYLYSSEDYIKVNIRLGSTGIFFLIIELLVSNNNNMQYQNLLKVSH